MTRKRFIKLMRSMKVNKKDIDYLVSLIINNRLSYEDAYLKFMYRRVNSFWA